MQSISLENTFVDDSASDRFGYRTLTLDRFRNYRSQVVTLSHGFNVVFGPNAQGKTNLLEALYLLSTTRLLRGQRDAEAILEGEQSARVSAELLASHTQVAVNLERGSRKRAFVNGLGLPRASDLLGRVPTIAFSAEDLSMVRGEPSERRLFLDLDLSALRPAYLRHLTLYKRALEQRNALLKSARERYVTPGLYEPWEAQLGHHGAALRKARAEYVEVLGPLAQESHGSMAVGESLHLSYATKDDAIEEEALIEALGTGREAEVARGGTNFGPHRDDLTIQVGSRDAKLFGSQGQQRTAVIAVKLGALRLAQNELGMPPLLLLDDIFSDLDQSRRAHLVETVLAINGQAVLTCTEPNAAGEELLKTAKVFSVTAGEVTEA